MKLLLLIAIVGIKSLLGKGLFIGLLLLLFYVKGRQLGRDSARWDAYLMTVTAEKAQRIGIVVYFAAALAASALGYLLLVLAGFRYAAGIAALLFAVGLIITACRYAKRKDELLEKFRAIPQKILAEREKEQKEHG